MESVFEPINGPESNYLIRTVGPILRTCLAELLLKRPADPISYLARSLKQYYKVTQQEKEDEENLCVNTSQIESSSILGKQIVTISSEVPENVGTLNNGSPEMKESTGVKAKDSSLDESENFTAQHLESEINNGLREFDEKTKSTRNEGENNLINLSSQQSDSETSNRSKDFQQIKKRELVENETEEISTDKSNDSITQHL